MGRLVKNITYSVIGQGIVLGLGFVGVKFMFSRLGADAFGIIYFSLLMTGVLTAALELGVMSTTVRQVSAYYATERSYVEQLVRTASLFYWGFSLVLSLAISGPSPVLVNNWVTITPFATASPTPTPR